VRAAARLRAPGGRLSVVLCDATPACTLVFPDGGVWIPDLEGIREGTQAWLAEQVKGLTDADAILLDGHAGWALSRWAAAAAPDLVVMSARGGRWGRRGTALADRLARSLPCPLLVLPLPAPAPAPRRSRRSLAVAAG
jgi:nucleotide-binding universal stress UspA family protein